MMHDIIVVGGGPAGMTAGIYAGRSGWKTLLLDPMGGGGQASTTYMIHNYPGFPQGVEGPALMELMREQASVFGVDIVYDEALRVEKEEERFIVKGAEKTYEGRAVIYAAGAAPRRLGVPGESDFLGKGISFCATCDGPLFKDRVVAVVGGGDSALTEAVFLAKFAKEVILIHRRREFRAAMAAVNLVKENPKIRIMFAKVVKKIKGDVVLNGLILEDTETREEETLKVDGLFLYVGLTPNTEPIKDVVRLGGGGFAQVGEDTATDTEGLFVAGDVREKPLRQVSTAVCDGAVAATGAEKYLLQTP